MSHVQISSDATPVSLAPYNIETILSSKVKAAINNITEEVINVLKSEVSKIRVNNNDLADGIRSLQFEIDRLRSENLSLKQEICNIKIKSNLFPYEGDRVPQSNEKRNNEHSQEQDQERQKNVNRKKNSNKHIKDSSSDEININTNQTINSNKNLLPNTDTRKTSYTGALKKSIPQIKPPNQNELISSAKNKDEFQVVTRRKKFSKSRIITGSAVTSTLKAITKNKYLYVTRLEKAITTEEIINYLKEKNFTEIVCEKMNSKRPDIYSSFKIGGPERIIEDLKQPEIWPVGAYVNPFLWRMMPQEKST